MKKISTFFMAFLLLNVLAAGGLVGYVVATGRLDGPKTKTILDMVRHQGTPEGLREQVTEILMPATRPATTQSAEAPQASVTSLDGAAAAVAASASERIAYAQQAVEQEKLRLEREAQDLQQRQKLLEVQRAELDAKLAEIEDKKKKFDAEVAAETARVKTESFAKTLAMYSDLKTKQVKELFMGMDPQTVADYLNAMDADEATKVIGEFKTAEERTFIGKILERIRVDGIGSANVPGGTGAAGINMPASRAAQARN